MSTFVLRYFGFPARAEITKAILTCAKADWKLECPVWPDDKAKQPVGQLPVLIETKPDGTEFVLTDSVAIETYLMKKFNVFIDVSLEQSVCQLQLRNQILDSCQMGWLYQFGGSDEVRQFAKQGFVGFLERVIKYHEQVLQENGSNGHYFGNKTGYADVALYGGFNALKSIEGLTDIVMNLFSEQNAPLMNKVLKAVESDSMLADYVALCKQ
ncbi:hypothetical protein J3B02_000013 [Coemansia erecta]|uniref:GST N-terminal domain-containing protein n=1 Tax=Coemansia asiatica TaxID=1052880 RepID=A0A9W8CIP9_9FUNG|nr:hypothetical protein LPJ64_002881 [Coemansia asiatica]KAJ2858634.1 hypothetical protein J3B02_000013 [Coemansia erecta]KAJ2887075.1 hypothetical protein FB639_001448 [Coemansia asiatica]